jgi:hypothetical protein
MDVEGGSSSSLFLLISFLPSPRRYNSGWALVSWIISLHFPLFFICSDDEASNDRMKKREECGWRRSWSTYFRWFCIHSSEANYLVPEQFNFYGVRLLVSSPTPNLEDQGIPLRLAPTPWTVRHGCPYQQLRHGRHSSQGLWSTQTPPSVGFYEYIPPKMY